MEDEKKTVLGINENLAAVLCYAGFWFSGLVFLFMEKENKFVRFHAMQSLVTFLDLFIVMIVVRVFPILRTLIAMLLQLLGVVLWILLMYKASKGEKYKLPVVGDFAEEQLNKR